MTAKKRNTLLNIPMILLQIMLCFFYVLTSLAHKISIIIAIKLFAFQFACILIPGLASVYLLKVKKKNSLATIAFAYVLGICLILIEYLLYMATGLSNYSYIISIIKGILCILYCIKKQITFGNGAIKSDITICFILILCVELFCFLALSLNNTLPTISNNTYYNKDFLFWVGNNISFTKGLPVQDFRVVGKTFNYHYFSSVLLAQTSLCINEDITMISLLFSPVLPCALLVLASYTLLSKVVKNKWYLFLGIILMLFADNEGCNLTTHLYTCAFGFDYGYIVGLLSLSYLIDMYKNDKYTKEELLVSCILIMMCTGFKGPISVVVLMGYAIVSLNLLIKKRFYLGFKCGFLWLLSFLFIYVVFVSKILNKENPGEGLFFVGILKAFNLNVGPQNIYQDLITTYGIKGNNLLKIVSIVIYLFQQNGFAFVFGILAFIYLVIKKENNTIMIMFLSICVWGAGIYLTTSQEGNSQLYFLSATIPSSVSVGLMALERIEPKMKNKIFMYVIIAILVIPNLYYFGRKNVVKNSLAGIQTYMGVRDKYINNQSKISGHVTEKELEFYEWIKNNTNSNDVIAVDSFEYNGEKKYEQMGVFSERFIWNDGKYTSFVNEVERRKTIIENIVSLKTPVQDLLKEGVSYFVKTPSDLVKYELDSNHTDLLYELDGYSIYRIK